MPDANIRRGFDFVREPEVGFDDHHKLLEQRTPEQLHAVPIVSQRLNHEDQLPLADQDRGRQVRGKTEKSTLVSGGERSLD